VSTSTLIDAIGLSGNGDKDDLLVRQSVAFRRLMARHLTFEPRSKS